MGNLSALIGIKTIARISNIPLIGFLIMAIFVGLSQAIDPIKNTHAAPGGPTTISASYDASSVDFHFTSADLANSAFKQSAVLLPLVLITQLALLFIFQAPMRIRI